MRAPRAATHPLRLHSRRCGSSSLLLCHAERTRRHRLQHKLNEQKQAIKDERKEERGSLVSFCNSAGGSAQDSTRSSACWLVSSELSARRLAETEGDHCRSGGTGQVHRHDSHLGHRAQSLETNVVPTSPVFSVALFGTEPHLVNTESKRERESSLGDRALYQPKFRTLRVG